MRLREGCDRLVRLLGWAAVALTVGASAALAFDGTQTPADDPSPVEAFRSGTKAYKAGDLAGASRALEFAAGKGHALAQWKLARMYSEGDGVPRDDAKAFEYYRAIVDAHSDESPDTPQARFVSSAMVALGSYYLTGIPNSRVQVDPQRAIQLFQYAATYFGDSDAQYNLGRLYLDGGPEHPRDPVMAARWLRLAANKGQHQAQAILGHLLFAGEDLPRQAARGLMYLTLARDGASGDADKWIIDSYNAAFAAATPEERERCLDMLERFLKNKS
jgi:TPR repeat protein